MSTDTTALWARIDTFDDQVAALEREAVALENQAIDIRRQAALVSLVRIVAAIEANEIDESGEALPSGTVLETLAWPEESLDGQNFDVAISSVTFPDGTESDHEVSDSFGVGYFAGGDDGYEPRTMWDRFATEPDMNANVLVLDVDKIHTWAAENSLDWRASVAADANASTEKKG